MTARLQPAADELGVQARRLSRMEGADEVLEILQVFAGRGGAATLRELSAYRHQRAFGLLMQIAVERDSVVPGCDEGAMFQAIRDASQGQLPRCAGDGSELQTWVAGAEITNPWTARWGTKIPIFWSAKPSLGGCRYVTFLCGLTVEMDQEEFAKAIQWATGEDSPVAEPPVRGPRVGGGRGGAR